MVCKPGWIWAMDWFRTYSWNWGQQDCYLSNKGVWLLLGRLADGAGGRTKVKWGLQPSLKGMKLVSKSTTSITVGISATWAYACILKMALFNLRLHQGLQPSTWIPCSHKGMLGHGWLPNYCWYGGILRAGTSYFAILLMSHISLCISEKNLAGILIGIILNLCIHLGRIGIFMTLSLSINKYCMSLYLLRSLIYFISVFVALAYKSCACCVRFISKVLGVFAIINDLDF